MNDAAMARRFLAGINKHHWYAWGKGSLADRTDHRLAATFATGGTGGSFVVDEVESIGIVHSSI
jgi:hypothetical protein